jgi:hypothetical protein
MVEKELDKLLKARFIRPVKTIDGFLLWYWH